MRILLFFILLSSFAFGQSPKKTNERLRAAFLLEQEKQDSSYRVFAASSQALEKEIDLIKQKRELLVQESRNHRQLKNDIRKFEATLKVLEPGLIEKEFKAETIPAYQDVIRPVENALVSVNAFEKVSNRLYLEMMKRREQNAALEAKINEYRLAAKENETRFQRNEQNRVLLGPIPARLDSILNLYYAFSGQLEIHKRKVEAVYLQKKEAYRLKGPKGFPETYQRAFPDVHPLPVDALEIVDRRVDDSGDVVPEPIAPPKPENAKYPEIFEVVDEPAEFPGGIAALKKYLDENIHYPQKAKEAGISGRVYLKFIVSDKGEISNVKLMRGMKDCPECDQEAIRVVKEMPKWTPGKNNGKIVDSVFNLPVQFKP